MRKNSKPLNSAALSPTKSRSSQRDDPPRSALMFDLFAEASRQHSRDKGVGHINPGL
ncbi:hypothetical protein XHV734_0852 [Xanthomonas hortorum pv. vitians]|nr:hypothetical protein XHV734_0852 [Xanthomonas hortorum pv. vitians]